MTKRKVKKDKRGSKKMPEGVLWFGDLNANTVFVVDTIVGREEDGDEAPKTTKPLSKANLSFFSRFLKEAKIKKSDLAIVCCAPPVTADMWQRGKAMGDHLKAHRAAFVEAIELIDPKLIVPMGKYPATQVAGRSVAITKVRGLPTHNEAWNRVVMPAFGVNHVRRIPDNEALFRNDMLTVGNLVSTNYSIDYEEEIETDYRYCTDISFLLKNPPKDLCVDCEWTGGEWFQPKSKLLTVQLTWEEGKAVSIPINYPRYEREVQKLTKKDKARIKAQLKKLLENKKVRVFGHNYKADYLYLLGKLGIDTATFSDDTMLMVHMHDENMLSKSLTDCIRRFVPAMSGYSDDFDRDPIHQGKSRMDLVDPQDMMMYGCGDTDATFRLWAHMRALLKKDKNLYRCYKRVKMPATRSFCKIEQSGFDVSKRLLSTFETKIRKHQNAEYARLVAMVPSHIRKEYLEDSGNPSITRGAFLIRFLFGKKSTGGLGFKPRVFTKSTKMLKDKNMRVPSTSTKDHFPYFLGEHPFIEGIIDFVKNEKMLGTYVGSERDNTGFYKYIFDDKIRPSYLLHRTVTGRTASANPNGQNFPKRGMFAKDYRKIFIAPRGYCLVEVDYSQVELRIAAMMANEPTMLEIYARNGDIHAATAAKTMGVTLEEFMKLPKKERGFKRFQAKAINFGFLYGMWWKSFIVYAKTDYGIDFTEEEAQKIRNDFFDLYKNLEPWHAAVKDFVNTNGYVKSYDGGIRHLPNIFSPEQSIAKMAERQAVNSPVQAQASNLGLIAMARIQRYVDPELVDIKGFIHDALICLVPEDRAIEAILEIKKQMENLPLKEMFGWQPSIPLMAEAEIGKNLSQMVEVEHSWYKDKNIKSYQDILIAEWKAECDEAKAEGKRPPRMPKVLVDGYKHPEPERTVKPKQVKRRKRKLVLA